MCSTQAGYLCIVAGTGRFGAPTPGPAISADLANPQGVAVDAAGNLYIADNLNHVVEKVTPLGALSVVAGTGTYGAPTPGPATTSDLDDPSGVAVDAAGNLYIADNFNHVVEKVTPSGALSVVAGTGTYGAPTPGPATSSDLGNPGGVAVDAAGDLFIADNFNHVVEKVTPSGALSVVAGTGSFGAPKPGPATGSDLGTPAGVAVDGAGDLYISDWGDFVVEKVTPSGTLSVVVGTGNSGEPIPGPATSSHLDDPWGVAVDAAGNLYVADYFNHVVERVTPSGTLGVIAGTGSQGAVTPGPATSSDLGEASGVAVDDFGDLYICDYLDDVVSVVAMAASMSVSAPPSVAASPTPSVAASPAPPVSTPARSTPSAAVSPAASGAAGPPLTGPALVVIAFAILLLAPVLVALLGPRRRPPANGTVEPPGEGGSPRPIPPLSPPPSTSP
jgi:sugar lactone lactonase YvrE